MKTCMVCVSGVLFAAGVARADIVQDAGVFSRTITFVQPVGQTFTAVDAEIASIGLAFNAINPSFPNDPVTVGLYEGSGFAGSLLGSVTVTLASLPSTSDAPVFYDLDFSGTSLTIGSVYTISVTTTNSPHVAVVYSAADPYADGHAIWGSDGPSLAEDLNFRVIAVPGVGTAGVLGAGLMLSGRRRR